jgi:hypothetical protein
MQPGIFRSCFDGSALRVGLLLGILLLCSAPSATLIGQDLGSSTGSVFHVHGVVLNTLTNKPVGRVLVTSMEMAAMTDGEGRFEFDVRLPIGNTAGGPGPSAGAGMRSGGGDGYPIALMARRPGYLTMQQPTMLRLRDKGPDEPELKIRITPESILRGRVATSAVAPPMGVQVQLSRKQVQDGLANWGPVATAQTNSRGEYRFADLATGDYKIMTREWVENESTVPVPDKQITGYPPVYYPNELDLATATPIHIAAGETAQADLNLRAQPYYRVSIPVMNVPHGTGVNVAVGDEDGSSGFSLGFNPQTQKIEGLLPNGSYDVRVMSFGEVQGAGAGRIEVAGGPVRGAPISLMSSGVIPVVVREEYTTDSSTGTPEGPGQVFSRIGSGRPRSLELMLQPDGTKGPAAGLRNSTGKGNEDLVVENVREGKYRVWVMPNRGYAASATSGGVDLLHKPLVVGAGGASAPIEITLRDDTATLEGTVSPVPPTGGEPNPYGGGVFVFCFPIESEVGRPVQGFAGVDGKFSMQNVPPGRYLVLAFRTPNQNLEYRNEEVLRQYESKGTIVTLEAGQKAEVKVPVLTEDEE